MKLFLILVLAAIAYSANGATLNKRDLRDNLLAKATALENQANSAIKSLVNNGRSSVAAELEREEKTLQRLATELKAATGEAAIRKLETEVKAAENRLATELRRIEGRSNKPSTTTTTTSSVVKRDVRDDVLAKAEAVQKNATAEIEKLKAEGRTMAATALQREEDRLRHVATELKAATGEAAIRRLEAEVRAIEARIEMEIRHDERATGSARPHRSTAATSSTTAASIVKRDAKDDVLAKAATVEKNVAAEEKKLRAEGRTSAAASLEREAKRLQTLVTELKAATAEATVTRIEGEIKALETRIQEEIKRDERSTGSTRAHKSTAATSPTTAASIVKRDVRDDVLAKAEAVQKNATAEIEKLKAEGRTMAATALQREEDRLRHVATELKAATGEAAIRRLEAEVRAIEARIEMEIRHDERATGSARPHRSTAAASSTSAPTSASF